MSDAGDAANDADAVFSGPGRVIDRGVVGWFRAVEVTGVLVDRVKVGGTVRCGALHYRVVKVARERDCPPENEDGVVVLTEMCSRGVKE